MSDNRMRYYGHYWGGIEAVEVRKKLSQNKLAKLSGIDRAYITRLEESADGHRISLQTLLSLAKGLDVPPEIFLQTDQCQNCPAYDRITILLYELRKACLDCRRK